MKKLVWLLILGSFFFAGCGQKTSQAAVETRGSLQGISQSQKVEITDPSESLTFQQENGQWFKEEQAIAFMPTFIEALDKVSGEKVKKPEEVQSLFSLKADKKEIEFYTKEEDYYFSEGNKTFLITNPPEILRSYEDLYFADVPYGLASATAVTALEFEGKGQEAYTLSQTSPLTKIEQAPFISGWYLNDYYHRSYSVNYDQSQKMLQTLSQLLVEPTEKRSDTASLMTKIQVTSQTEQQSEKQMLQIYQEEQQYFLQLGQEYYRLAAYQAKQLAQPPFEWIDPFSALILADALTELDVKVDEEAYLITAEHQMSEDQKSILSEFKLNNQAVDEATFRKTYQYCGVLSGSEEYANQTLAEQPFAELSYQFVSEGQTQTRVITYIPLVEDQSLVAISENDQIDFVMEKQLLLEMAQALDKLAK